MYLSPLENDFVKNRMDDWEFEEAKLKIMTSTKHSNFVAKHRPRTRSRTGSIDSDEAYQLMRRPVKYWTREDLCIWIRWLGYDPADTETLLEMIRELHIHPQNIEHLCCESLAQLGLTTSTQQRYFMKMRDLLTF